jgi:hypothetical protein
MPFKKEGGPGFYVNNDDLAWAIYDEVERTGKFPTIEELLNRDQRVVDTYYMCAWLVKRARDEGIDPFTHEKKGAVGKAIDRLKRKKK